MGKIEDFGDFCGRHWGDVTGLIILFTGVGLEVFNAVSILKWGVKLEGVHEMAASFTMAAMGVLKLRSVPKANGNGHTDETVVESKPEEKKP